MSTEKKPYLKLNSTDLRRVLPFKAVNDVRYYINGVRVEPTSDGCNLIATNGHMLAVVHSRDSHADEPCIVRTGRWFCKAFREPGLKRLIAQAESKESSLGLYTKYGSLEWSQPGSALIDGKYPDWRKVVPDDETPSGIVGGFAPHYLARVFRSIAEVTEGDQEAQALKLYQKNAASPLLLRGRQMFIVLMPLRRVDDLSPAQPNWMES